MSPDELLKEKVRKHPHPLLFATISGAHLYGFPSPDSDFDLRGCHILPLDRVIGLDSGPETIESSTVEHGVEIDLVSHDVHKFFALMLKRNGYVLEQLLSPLIVHTTPEHEELRSIAPRFVTRHHAHHYLGFAQTQWKLFDKESPRRVKPLLYTFRVLLTGLHLMKTGEIEANLPNLNIDAKLPYIDELIRIKTTGKEKGTIDDRDLEFYRAEYDRLLGELEAANLTSNLPENSAARPELDALLKRLRLSSM